MCGCVSAEPSARGCGVSARLPEGSTRRPSFSMPRRMPLSRWGSGTAMDACDVFILVYRFVDGHRDRKSTRLNSSHLVISYAVFCLKKKKCYSNSECQADYSAFALIDTTTPALDACCVCP